MALLYLIIVEINLTKNKNKRKHLKGFRKMFVVDVY